MATLAPSSRLRGRTVELRTLAEALGRAAGGRPAIVVVEGEAGIGKSRLLAEALEAARSRGLEVVAGRGPLVLGLDDLQWADPSSLLTLGALARRLTVGPVALVASLRPLPRGRELERTLEAFDAAGAHRLALGQLDPEAVAELVAEAVAAEPGPTLMAEMAAAGGNPLFVTELVAALLSEGAVRTVDGRAEVVEMTLPPNLRLTILRRLSFLPEQTLEALRPASILGSSFSLTELSATTDRSVLELSSVLAEAIRAKVLEDDGERLRFRHDLIHEAIYEDLPASVRLALHREAGRRLAEAEATCRMLLDRERDPSVAAQARILLSRTLATQGRIREALQELERVQQSPGLAGKPRAAAWAAESMARVDLGDLDGAEAAAERVRTTAAGLGDHPAIS